MFTQLQHQIVRTTRKFIQFVNALAWKKKMKLFFQTIYLISQILFVDDT